MIPIESTINEQEIRKFAEHAPYWWDESGPLKTLHDINPIRVAWIKQAIDINNKTLLDVGCGGGILCEALAGSGARVSGIDAALEAIETAKAHAIDNGLFIDYHHSPIEDYEQGGYDVITCMELLEHIDHPEQVLAHCQRLLKPDGLLFVSTISRTLKAYASAVLVAEYLLGLLPKQTHDYKHFIKPSEMASMARGLGFTLLEMKGMNYNPLTRQASLSDDVSVNYLMVFQRSII